VATWTKAPTTRDNSTVQAYNYTVMRTIHHQRPTNYQLRITNYHLPISFTSPMPPISNNQTNRRVLNLICGAPKKMKPQIGANYRKLRKLPQLAETHRKSAILFRL
jgi:hypothetical protein